MKNTILLSTVFLGLLMVFGVSCTTMQEANSYPDEGLSNANAPSRIYVEDPYNPGRTILVERDPFTGRYYQVSPYSSSVYNSRYYNNRYYNNRYYDPYARNYGYPSRGNVYPQRQSEPRPAEPQREDIRKRVLGDRKQ